MAARKGAEVNQLTHLEQVGAVFGDALPEVVGAGSCLMIAGCEWSKFVRSFSL